MYIHDLEVGELKVTEESSDHKGHDGVSKRRVMHGLLRKVVL